MIEGSESPNARKSFDSGSRINEIGGKMHFQNKQLA